ncbi:hypothetical protein [Arthrobacter castelli]|uniref:hypothetical protein n=1 Tax=Arthrobacter castelli TaxID=271431 RepID=UPI00047EFC0E|nr:hypothetical protein [Arthrobacter castelli]
MVKSAMIVVGGGGEKQVEVVAVQAEEFGDDGAFGLYGYPPAAHLIEHPPDQKEHQPTAAVPRPEWSWWHCAG